jgi:hypothetical protein
MHLVFVPAGVVSTGALGCLGKPEKRGVIAELGSQRKTPAETPGFIAVRIDPSPELG